MSGRGPHPPARNVTRGYRTAHRHPPGVGGCPRGSRVFLVRAILPFFASRRFATQGRARAATRPEHIHKSRQRDARLVSRVASRRPCCKSNLPSVSSPSSSSSSSFYLEYVISGAGGVEEGCRLSTSRLL